MIGIANKTRLGNELAALVAAANADHDGDFVIVASKGLVRCHFGPLGEGAEYKGFLSLACAPAEDPEQAVRIARAARRRFDQLDEESRKHLAALALTFEKMDGGAAPVAAAGNEDQEPADEPAAPQVVEGEPADEKGLDDPIPVGTTGEEGDPAPKAEAPAGAKQEAPKPAPKTPAGKKQGAAPAGAALLLGGAGAKDDTKGAADGAAEVSGEESPI